MPTEYLGTKIRSLTKGRIFLVDSSIQKQNYCNMALCLVFDGFQL